MRLSISEIIRKASTMKTADEQKEWLKKNESIALRTVLKCAYDERVVFLIPNTPPPWKKNDYVGVEGMLYNEARRLKIFVKGGGYDDMNKVKREQLFISLLEDIDNADAELLTEMIKQKPFANLSKDTVKEVFPADYS